MSYAVIEKNLNEILEQEFKCNPSQCGAIIDKVRDLARASGYGVDDRFAAAGLGAGPEARVASDLVNLAHHNKLTASSWDAILKQIEDWKLKLKGKGKM